MKCSKCSGNLPKEGELATCLQCKKKLHYHCAQSDTPETEFNINSLRDSWKCKNCLEAGDKPKRSTLNPFRYRPLGLGLNRNFGSETHLTKSKKDLKNELENISNITKDLKESAELNREIYVKIADLDSRISSLEQKLIKHDIEIANLPHMSGENLLNIIKAVGLTVGQNIKSSDVLDIFRTKQEDANKSRIVVTFRDFQLKKAFLSKVKKIKPLTYDKINKNIPDTKKHYSGDKNVLVYDRLTPFKKRLLWLAEQKAHEADWKYVWDRDGRVYARKVEGGPIVLIAKEEDIEKISNDNQ